MSVLIFFCSGSVNINLGFPTETLLKGCAQCKYFLLPLIKSLQCSAEKYGLWASHSSPSHFYSQDNGWVFHFSVLMSSQSHCTLNESIYIKHFAGCWAHSGTVIALSYASGIMTLPRTPKSFVLYQRYLEIILGRVLWGEHLILFLVL